MLTLIFIALLICMKVYFVISQRTRGKIPHPYREGLAIGFFFGLLYDIVYVHFTEFDGELREVSAIFSSFFILIFFIVVGALIAKLYRDGEKQRHLQKYFDEMGVKDSKEQELLQKLSDDIRRKNGV